ncbi:MAG TPA: RNA polymerase sigma factor [Polyangiaceae bacterium]|nr:RNA polymerase sigma factor [Polyangiaceae bacterium]
MATGLLRRLVLASPDLAPPATGSLSFQQVYEAHFQYIWRCLRGLGVSEHALDDAVHDVFLVVQRKLPSFDGSQASVTTWLYEIALRVGRRYRCQTAKDAQRSVSLAPPEHDDGPGELAGDAADPGCELEQAERLALARRALAALDADKREAFVLGCVEQRSAPEIAELTGVPLNTVYSRLRAARRLFAAEIARLEAARGRRAR